MITGSVIINIRYQMRPPNNIARWVRVHPPSAFQGPVVNRVCAVVKNPDSVLTLVAAHGKNVNGRRVHIFDLESKDFGDLVLCKHGHGGMYCVECVGLVRALGCETCLAENVRQNLCG